MSGHRRWSPSSLERVFECTASPLFIESLPPSKVDRSDSIYARRGTCGHEVSEMVLGNSEWVDGELQELAPVETYHGQEVYDIIVDDEIIAAINPYIKYCQRQMRRAKFYHSEQQLDLAVWNVLKNSPIDGVDVGGTMDFIAIYEAKKHVVLEITDLKTGSGKGVEVENNPQLLCYALCALIKYYKQFKPTRIKITIVQPPFDHPAGPIRSVMITPKQLIAWAKNTLVPKLEEALEGGVFNPSEDTCQWCPARAQCSARYEFACDNALAEFSDVTEVDDDGTSKQVVVLDQPLIKELSEEQRYNILLHGDEIIQFIKDIKASAHIQAEKGQYLEGFKLVRKRANRVYSTDAKTLRRELGKLGLHPADYMCPPVMKSPSQVEILMNSKGVPPDKLQKFLQNNVEKPETGTNLVLESHPGKPVQSAVETEFAHLIESDDDEDLLAF